MENGYLCEYAADQETYQVFLVPLESDTAAQAVWKQYHAFLEAQGYRFADQRKNHVMIAEKDGYVLAFALRSHFGGVLNVKNEKQGKTVIETMMRSLPK